MKKIQGGVTFAFDFARLATLPAYQEMIMAISDAGNATKDLLTDEQWAQLLTVAGEVARYGDRCNGCGRSFVFPFRCIPTDHGVAMTYLCYCGNTWFTSYGDSW